MDEQDLALLTSLLDKDVELGEVNDLIYIYLGLKELFYLQKLRDQGTEFEKKTRAIVGLLNRIHSTPSDSSASSNSPLAENFC